MGNMGKLHLRRPQQAVGKPDAHGAQKAEYKPHHQTGSGHKAAVKVKNGNAQHRQHGIGPQNAEHLGGADKGPNAVIQPEHRKNRDCYGTPGQNGLKIAVQMLWGNVLKDKVIPKPQSEKIAGNRCQDIQHRHHNSPGCRNAAPLVPFRGKQTSHAQTSRPQKGTLSHIVYGIITQYA